jgi:hypothetical protein
MGHIFDWFALFLLFIGLGAAIVGFITCFRPTTMYIKTDEPEKPAVEVDPQSNELFKQWTNGDSQIYFEYKFASVYYLNPANEIRKVDIKEFRNLQMPTEDLPEFWILRLQRETYETSKDRIYLVSKTKTVWNIKWGSIATLYTDEKNLYVPLADHTSEYIYVFSKVENGEDTLYANVLKIVSNPENTSLAALWYNYLKQQAPAILLETKGEMGKSIKIERLRRFIEDGPKRLSWDFEPVINPDREPSII